MQKVKLKISASLIALASVSAISPAIAQSGELATSLESPGIGEITVMARKREESILKVPVVVDVVSKEQLENFQVSDITDLPRLVPGLVIGGNLLSIGPQITIRGVGTSSSDPGVDQSVSLNVDGMSLGHGLAFRSAMFDMERVEVLRGPQALFFGKSSPGGVVSIRTADPGSELEVMVRAGYEFDAKEKRGELVVSGPATDTLGVRLATSYSEADGYFRNKAVPLLLTGASAPNAREPRPRSYVLRGTLLWEPTEALSARLKLNRVYDRTGSPHVPQLVNCPEGPGQAFGFGGSGPALGLSPVDPLPFIGGACKLDRDIHLVSMNPAFFPGIPNGGHPYLRNGQNYGTLEINYDLMPDLSLTSVMAYYKLGSSSLVNSSNAGAAAPTLAITNNFGRREFTEELRLNSDYTGAFNFTAGGFYQDGQMYDRVKFIQNRAYGFLPAGGGLDIDRATTINIRTYSLFGQLRFTLSDQLELAGGVRWTDETRSQHVFDFRSNTDITPTLPRTEIGSSNFSPEITLTYTPTDDLTVFGSLKQAYKSGSFKISVPAVPGENNAFGDEKVRGGEVGIKSRWLDRSLLVNVAGYYYKYRGLQVGGIEPSINGSPVIRTVNAGGAETYGIDFDAAYHPRAMDGLELYASLNWNHARYTKLDNIPCYSGQTVEQGCTKFPNPANGRFTAQDLSGTQMIRAPEWAANFGFTYEVPIGSGMTLAFGNNNQLSSKYPVFQAVGRPNNDSFQAGFIKVDANIALKGIEDLWELALIGKNITDKVTGSHCSATNFAGGLALGGAITGGANSGPAGFSEKSCNSDVGRAVWVRLTWRPF